MAEAKRSWDVTRLLGIGRTSDIAEGDTLEEGDRRLTDLPVESISANPHQPRQHFGEQELADLARSISEVGVIQPLVVRAAGEGRFELVAGERRLRASRMAGLSSVPAIVVDVTPEQQELMALVENLQRRDLSSVEEARSFESIMGRMGWTQSELARRLGASQSSVANKMRLLNLDPPVQELVRKGSLGERHARALLPLATEEQLGMARRVIDEKLTVKALEREVKQTLPAPPRAAAAKRSVHPVLSATEAELLQSLMDLSTRFRDKGLPLVLKVKEKSGNEMVCELRMKRKR